MKNRIFRNATMVSLLALTVAISACSSDDDDDPIDPADDATTAAAGNGGDTMGATDGGAGANPDESTATVTLDSATTVPPADVDGAAGDGSFTVDTNTGAVSGSVTVTGTSGVPTAAHLHSGAAGETGPVLIPLVGSEDGTVWTAGPDAALDAAGIAAYEAGEVYINVHTDENPDGELRAQLVADAVEAVPVKDQLEV